MLRLEIFAIINELFLLWLAWLIPSDEIHENGVADAWLLLITTYLSSRSASITWNLQIPTIVPTIAKFHNRIEIIKTFLSLNNQPGLLAFQNSRTASGLNQRFAPCQSKLHTFWNTILFLIFGFYKNCI